MKRVGFIDGRRVAGWSFPATATPGNGQVVDVTDPSAGAVGSLKARKIIFRPTGNKTGINYLSAQCIEVHPQGDTYTLRALDVYFAAPVGTPTIHQYFAHDVFMEPIGVGNQVHEMCGLSLGMNYTNATIAVNSTMLRLYVHGAVPMPSAIRIAGSGVTNLFYFQRAVAPMENQIVGAPRDRRLRVEFGDIGVQYLALYDG